MAAFWNVSAGVTQSADAWGISALRRTRQTASGDKVRFKVTGLDVDSDPPFAYKEPMTITRDGVGWFSGIVTSLKPVAQEQEEYIAYEVSSPWWWLEQTTYQQMWVTATVTGAVATSMTTAQSYVTLAQSLDAVKMNSGQVIEEALIYAQYAYQGLPYPATVDVNHLPKRPDPSKGPFRIGVIEPSITTPYLPTRDKSCAAIINLMLKYSPDCVTWFDYTTTPPTLNIGRRSSLQGKVISYGDMASRFSPRPRPDLQVPAVFAKFQTTVTNDGESKSVVVVDQYPKGVADNIPGAWVQTIDLVGASVAYQKETVSVISIPDQNTSALDCLNWILKHNSSLQQYDFKPSSLASSPNTPGLFINDVKKVVDPNDPALGSPYHMPADGTGYNNELVGGSVAPWMWDTDQLLSAAATILMTFIYNGSDTATRKYFKAQTPPGTLIVPVRTKITNAGGKIGAFSSQTVTKEYQTVASSSAGEPVPVGFAQALYASMAELHYDGELTIEEEECSDRLPLGCTFNTSDGRAEWQGMNALVLRVEEDVDAGRTEVTFGPPVKLGLDTMEELFRANVGRLPSYQLDQRTSGNASQAGNVVQGQSHSSASSSHMPPGASEDQPFPFQVTWRNKAGAPGVFEAKVEIDSTLWKSQNSLDNAPITGLDSWFNLDADDTIWIVGGVVNQQLSATPPTIHSYGQGHTDYIVTAPNWTPGSTVEDDNAAPPNVKSQIWFRRVIAISVADANGQPQISQKTSTNLVLQNTPIDGRPAIYPFPL